MKTYLRSLFPLLMAVLMGSPTLAQQAPEITAPAWIDSLSHVRWGSLSVPENHDAPRGRHIRIAYVVVKAQDSTANQFPIIFFAGGPGGNAIDPGLVGFLQSHPLTATRDLILFDQRGIGFSSPLPDMSMASFNILAQNANPEQELQLTGAMIADYKQRCQAAGIQPEYYNSFQNARDVGMLMEGLGYEKYNLFGGSYGTRLARVVQDLFPNYIYSSVLDSPSPLSTDFLVSRLDSYSLALERILDYCAGQPGCHTEYPRLKDDYFKALKRLRKEPMEVRFSDAEVFWVNEQDGIYLLRRLLYMDGSREKAPRLIRALLEGDVEPVKEVLQYEYALTNGLNLSMLLSVERFENFRPENTPAVIAEKYREHPLIPVPMGFFDAFYRAGQGWHEAVLPVSERTFRPSAIPTLIFANRYDPVTPPEYGTLFMETLSQGQLLILDESGHGAGNQDCKDQVMAAFMDDPEGTLDTSCLNLFRE